MGSTIRQNADNSMAAEGGRGGKGYRGGSSASRERTSGVDQIGTAIVHLDSVIRQNASASEELASAPPAHPRDAKPARISAPVPKANPRTEPGHPATGIAALPQGRARVGIVSVVDDD